MTTSLLISFLLLQQPSAQTPAQDAPSPQQDRVAANDGLVRMRKLHLVRPELLPYPLAYEVYC